MLKIFIINLFLLLALTLKSENIIIPDTNFKQALVNNTKINTNGDIEISKAEAALFTGEIHVAGKNIYNLIGLEYFIHISSLNCQNNHLNHLNTKANIKLKTLNCSYNQIKHLEIKYNTLNKLNCSHNLLDSLDVRTNPLSKLDCSYNNITKIYLPYQNTIDSKYDHNKLSTNELAKIKNTNIDLKSSNQIETFDTKDELVTTNKEHTDPSIQIYPNPVQDIMFIKFTTSAIRIIRIHNLNNILKLEQRVTKKVERIDLSKYKTGMYIMKIETYKDTYIYKFIKI